MHTIRKSLETGYFGKVCWIIEYYIPKLVRPVCLKFFFSGWVCIPSNRPALDDDFKCTCRAVITQNAPRLEGLQLSSKKGWASGRNGRGFVPYLVKWCLLTISIVLTGHQNRITSFSCFNVLQNCVYIFFLCASARPTVIKGAGQQVSPSNLTKYCAWQKDDIPKYQKNPQTSETSFTMSILLYYSLPLLLVFFTILGSVISFVYRKFLN